MQHRASQPCLGRQYVGGPPADILRAALVGLVGLLTLSGCATTPGDTAASTAQLRVKVLEVLPHDPNAFTQGFEIADGTLYEGTGLEGKSAITAGPPGKPPRKRVELPDRLFGEGITVVGDRIWQLTWKAGIAIERDRATLAATGRAHYPGEGWGLCHQDGKNRLVMSDGSAEITFRDPGSFEVLGSTTVRADGEPVDRLNELECAGGQVYANVWQTNTIVRIEPASGRVTASIDASGLLTSAEAQRADVLNGIAAVPGSDEFLITGKLWPKTFRVRFVPAN